MKKNRLVWFFRKEKLLKISRMMRLVVFMMVCLNLTVSAKVYSQAGKFSVQKKNATVKEVFDEIMRHSDYHFFYNNEFDVNRKVSIDMKNADIDALIKKVLEGQSYSYKLVDNYIIIKRENVPAEPQGKYARKVKGVVKDTEGSPLPGVSVMLAGSSLGVATDIDGKFVFAVPGPGSILKFSFIGKKTVEVVVEDETDFQIVMEDDEKVLEEVVCTGVQTISRERATGAFELLNSEDLDRTLTSDVVSRMQGKIAGVQVDQNNKISIRGRGSILSNTEPLIVVDGFPIEGGLKSVNPDDIETITVLKDAAAASIWGVRAANGVVVITTKSGTREKPTLDVSYFLTVNQKTDLKDLHLMTTEQSVDLQLESIYKGFWMPAILGMMVDYPANQVQQAYYDSWINKIDPTNPMDMYELYYDEVMSDPSFQKQIADLKKINLQDQYAKYLLRRAVGNRLNLSLRGGTERSDYYISAVYDRQLLESIGDKSNNLLFNLKHNYKLARRLTLSSSVNIEYTNADNNGIGVAEIQSDYPFQGLLDAKGNRMQHYMISSTAVQGLEGQGYMSYTKNLLDDQELNDNTSNTFSARLNAALKLNIIEGLDVETRFQYERGYSKTENLIKSTHSSLRKIINDYSIWDAATESLNYQVPLGDKLEESRNDYEAWTWRSQLTFNKDWNDSKHMLAAVLGHEMRMYKTSSHSQSLYGYDPVSLTYAPVNEEQLAMDKIRPWFGEFMMGDSGRWNLNRYGEVDNRDLSVYLNAAYTFNSRYTLSASGRIDQSNLFGNDSDYKYNFIWSTGLSWRISEEDFAKTDWMDQLLVRLTYGIGGNVNKDFYPVLMGVKDYQPGVGHYIYLTNPANKDLTWEKSTTVNAGVDFAFLTNRISGSLDYYHKKGTDLLGRVALDPTNGFESATVNFASVVNQGVEFTLNTVPLKINGFTWNLGFNISYNHNEVTKVDVEGSTEENLLAPAPPLGENGIAVKGKPLGRLYAYNYAGLDKTGSPLLWENGEKVGVEEYNQSPEALVYMGTTEAPWAGGISTSFEYKGITLAANATYKFGHKFRLPVSSPVTDYGYNTIADRWRQEGDENYTMVPALPDGMSFYSFDIARYYEMANIHVRDAAYLRLNEISLGYRLPQRFLAKGPVKAIDVQFQVRNACLWTKNKENVDPEAVIASSTYISCGSYGLPQPRSFILGIKATF